MLTTCKLRAYDEVQFRIDGMHLTEMLWLTVRQDVESYSLVAQCAKRLMRDK